MQQNTKCGWLHKSFVFLLSILIATSFMVPGSFGAFGAQEAYAANGSVAINGGNGTIELLMYDKTSGSWVDVNGGTAHLAYNDQQQPEPQRFKLKVTGANQDVVNQIKIEVPEGMSMNAYGRGDETFKRAMSGDPVVTSCPSVTYIRGLQNGGADISKYTPYAGTDVASATWTTVIGAVSYETEIVVSPLLPYHYSNVTDALSISYTEDVEGSNPQTYRLACDAQIDLPSYNFSSNTVIHYYQGSSAPATMSWGSFRLQGAVFGKVKYVFTLPEGVKARLDSSRWPNVGEYFTLSEPDPEDGNKITLEGIKTYAGWSYGQTNCPIAFDIDATAPAPVTVEGKLSFTTLDGAVLFSNVKKDIRLVRQAVIEGEHVAVQYDSVTAARSGRTKATTQANDNVPSRLGEGAIAQKFSIANAGQATSAPKTVRFKFNTDKFRMVSLPMFSTAPLTSLTLSTVDGEGNPVKENEKITIPESRQAKYYSDVTNRHGFLTAKELGIGEDEYISEVTYDIGTLAAGEFRACWPLYQMRDWYTGQQELGTIECYSTEDPTVTSGEGKLLAGTSYENLVMFSGGAPVSVSAGETTPLINISLGSNGGINMIDRYRVYICVPEKASLADLKITSGRGDITNEVKVTGPLESTGLSGTKRYYLLDFLSVPDHKASYVWHHQADGRVNRGDVNIYYKIKTHSLTPSGAYRHDDNIFVEYPDLSNSINVISNGYKKNVGGNPYGFPDAGKLVTLPNNNALSIYAQPDLQVVSTAKTEEMRDYVVYDGSLSSVLPIGITSTDKVNLKTSITNYSGLPTVDGSSTDPTTVWVPIPKKGDNWHRLSKGCVNTEGTATEEVPFSLNLLEMIQGVDTSVWDIYYGADVRPPATDSYPRNWDQDTTGTWWKNPTSLTKEQLKRVSCIKLVANSNIPAFDNSGTDTPYTMDLIASLTVDEEDKQQKNSIAVVAPLAYRNLSTAGGGVTTFLGAGEATAVTIARGKIKGYVFYDANHDGKKDAGESYVSGTGDGPYKVQLYGGVGSQKLLLKEVQVDADGRYTLQGLATGADYNDYYNVAIVNMDGQPRDFRRGDAGNQPTSDELVVSPVVNTNGKSVDNAFAFASDATGSDPEKAGYALLNTVVPIEVDSFDDVNEQRGGLYNLGVYGADEQTTVSFSADTAKGTLTAQTQASGVTVESETTSSCTYKGAASDALVWPKPNAKSGYEFKGWKLQGSPDSMIVYPTAPDNASFGSRNVAYEAVFAPLSYPVTFKGLDGATPASINALNVSYNDVLKGLTDFPGNPTKEGFEFLGWEITSAPAPLVTGNMLGDTDKMPAGPVELTAKWRQKSYTVNYEMNGAADIASKTVKYTDGSLAPATAPTWEGRSFEGWYIDESFKTKYENQTYKQIAKADNVEEITLYAKWSTNSYKVSFNTAGADSSTPDTINVTYGTTIVSHPDFPKDDPVRPGYSFDGWYTKDITGSEAKLKNSDLMPAKAVTLTAKWTEKSYTVKYNTDGGSQVDDMTGVKWGQTGLIPSTAPKKTGRTFDGWYTASGAKYENQPYSAIATNDNEMSITLTAHWSDTQYTVKYDTDGGTKIDDRSVNWDDGYLAPVNTPKKDGYTFEGWFTNAQKTTAYNNQRYSQLAANDSQESITLYVKWEPTADMRAAMAVKDLIDALPPEGQITPEDGEQIRGAEKAYKDLNSEQQRLLDVLDSASKPTLDNALAKLKEVEDQAAADAVTDKINALPVKEEVKIEDEAAITDARKAYEALTDDQKKLITEETLAKLTAAEEGLAAVKEAAALAKAKNDAKAELDKVDVNLYEEPELSVVKKAIDDGKKEIDAATTIPQVDAAKKKALDTIAAQKTAAQKAEEQKKQDEDPKNIPTEVTDKTPANLVAVTTAITTAKNDGDLKGSTYAPLKFMSKKQTKNSIKLQWSKVKGAKQYTVYANQCGTKNKYKKLATVKGKTLNVKKVAGKKLKKGANYKFLIIAENGDKVSAISKTLHIRTAGHKKYANYKSVSVKKTVIKKAKKLKKGKTLKLNAKGVVPKGKKVSVHVKTRYESANKKVATVTKAGKVKGIKKGKAKIYCYVQNGLAKVVTVTVK